MRKSERIRILELEVVRQQYELEYLRITLQAFMESKGMELPDMDSGKWDNFKKK